jgi:hypothetical protein
MRKSGVAGEIAAFASEQYTNRESFFERIASLDARGE